MEQRKESVNDPSRKKNENNDKQTFRAIDVNDLIKPEDYKKRRDHIFIRKSHGNELDDAYYREDEEKSGKQKAFQLLLTAFSIISH